MLDHPGLEDHINFHTYTAALPPVIETEDFGQFLTRFRTASPPLLSYFDIVLLENNMAIFTDLSAHYDRACQLKLWKRTHYTQGTMELPDSLKMAYRLLLAGVVANMFPNFNPVDEKDRVRWNKTALVLVGLRNVAFEMVGVESGPKEPRTPPPLFKGGMYHGW